MDNTVSFSHTVGLSLSYAWSPPTHTDGRVEIKESDDQSPVKTARHSGSINGLSVKNCRSTISFSCPGLVINSVYSCLKFLAWTITLFSVFFTVHFTRSLWLFQIICRVVWNLNCTEIGYNCQICIFVDLCLKNDHTLKDYCDGVWYGFFFWFFLSIEMFTFWLPSLRSLSRMLLFSLFSRSYAMPWQST